MDDCLCFVQMNHSSVGLKNRCGIPHAIVIISIYEDPICEDFLFSTCIRSDVENLRLFVSLLNLASQVLSLKRIISKAEIFQFILSLV